nr:hypothetical protein [Marasmius tenuissimus]
MKNNNKKFIWVNKVYSTKIAKILLTDEIVRKQITRFFAYLSSLNKESKEFHILILFRVQFNNNDIATIGNLQKFNIESEQIEEYIKTINKILAYKDDHYRNDPIKNFIFSYSLVSGKTDSKNKDINPNKFLNESNDYLTYYQYKLPIAFHPMDYEDVIKYSNYDYNVPLKNSDSIKIKLINKTSTECVLYHRNKVILEYKDTKIDDNTFIRKINRNKYTFVLGKIELMESEKVTKFITPLMNKNKKTEFDFLTLDIETYLDKNNLNVDITNNVKTISCSQDFSPIMNEVKKINPDWTSSSDKILSPLEENNQVLNFLIDNLNDIFIINSVTVYLLFIVTLMLTFKFLINKDFQFSFLNKITFFNIGIKINSFIKWYINLWHKTSILWIFFILTVLFFTNLVSSLVLQKILIILTNLK